MTEPAKSGRARAWRMAFYVLVVLYGLLLLSPLSPLPFVVLAWFLGPEESGGVSHRVHDLIFGTIVAIGFVGLLAQLRRPQTKVAPMQQLVIPILLLALTDSLILGFDPFLLIFLVPPFVIAALHPARGAVFKPSIRPSRALLGMVVVAAVPLLVFAVGQFVSAVEGEALAAQPAFRALEEVPEADFEGAFEEAVQAAGLSAQETELVKHFFHWGGMGAFALIVIILALVTALRIRGFRVTGWTVGLALAYFGLASVLTPDDASSGGYLWGGLAIAWGLAYLALVEWEARSERITATTR